MISYTEEKFFTMEQAKNLFLSVHWVSGQYPEKLYHSLMNAQAVLTAWDGEALVGMVKVLDDGAIVAYVHCLLVHPQYQGQGIAGHLINLVKERYKDYFYIEVMPEESENAAFYEKFGFHIMEDGVAMQICNQRG